MPDETAYLLTHDVERFAAYETDYQADLKIENVAMSERLAFFDEKPFPAPRPVIYRGYPPIIETLDFPVADNSWTIVSTKMLDALRSVGSFSHRVFPVAVVDSRNAPEEWFDARGNLRSEKLLKNYAAIQLTRHLDVFDYEKSKYERNENFPDELLDVREYVFKTAKNGLPPLFHVKNVPVRIFVSHEARIVLKAEKITGIEYVSLKGLQRGKGMFVDVPTPLPADK